MTITNIILRSSTKYHTLTSWVCLIIVLVMVVLDHLSSACKTTWYRYLCPCLEINTYGAKLHTLTILVSDGLKKLWQIKKTSPTYIMV